MQANGMEAYGEEQVNNRMMREEYVNNGMMREENYFEREGINKVEERNTQTLNGEFEEGKIQSYAHQANIVMPDDADEEEN